MTALVREKVYPCYDLELELDRLELRGDNCSSKDVLAALVQSSTLTSISGFLTLWCGSFVVAELVYLGRVVSPALGLLHPERAGITCLSR